MPKSSRKIGAKKASVKSKKPKLKNRKPTKKSIKKSAPKPDEQPALVVNEFQLFREPALSADQLRQVVAGIAVGFCLVFIFGLTSSIQALAAPSERDLNELVIHDRKTAVELRKLALEAGAFEQAQAAAGLNLVESGSLDQKLAAIQVDIQLGKHKMALDQIEALKKQLAGLQTTLGEKQQQKALDAQIAAVAAGNNQAGLNVPILMYHNPPADFDAQLDFLQSHGYTSISLDQLDAALAGYGSLPPKPVVITLDDGFSSQMSAVASLQRHRMAATFYIITGGERSNWCIGANRRNFNCGDNYLTWSQIKAIDSDPLFTIAGHTVDHSNLASMSPEEQRFEIVVGKQIIEQNIGHPIRHFAYPYGSFNGITASIARQAGYVDAVSTLPGTIQSVGNLYSLHRIREATTLP
jgi:peptidoglycan/xylan/chitin deacetylase (PgdA/CDA1 family)